MADGATSTAPLEVELLVCPHPECHRVGKLPLGTNTALKGWCTGPRLSGHPKVRMEPRRFVEAVE